MKVYVKYDDQWLYPDEAALGTQPYQGQTLQLNTCVGGSCGIQILADELEQPVTISAEHAQIMLLRQVTVPYNTAVEETSGFDDAPFVYLQQQSQCPAHCTRLVPFQVYDPYIPYDGQPLQGEKQAFFVQPGTLAAGAQQLTVRLQSAQQEVFISLQLCVYQAGLPQKPTFSLDHWFSLEAMADRHGLPRYSPEHFEKIREYAHMMASMRQTHFMITPDIIYRDNKTDFTLLEQVADIFFSAGLQTMKIGPIGQRKRVYHEDLLALAKDSVPVSSPEGQRLLHSFFAGLSQLAHRKHWQDKIVFHLADEPDEPESAIAVRMEQYALLRQLVRQYFPEARVCEAVKTAKFQEYIDILVPLSKTYEQDKASFDQALEKGREVWVYTCCVPIGNYYQRFLDVPLHSCRNLFWSIARNHITGYLHWGMNQLEPDQDPFLQTNQSHTYGDGKILPAGDSHILYPDGDKLYCSMRMHMYRKGCEDAELLKRLEAKNSALWQELTEAFVQFHGDADVQATRSRSLQLLKALQE